MFASTIPSWADQAFFTLILTGGLTLVFRSLMRSLREWTREQFEVLNQTTKATNRQVTPNGGNTNSNGDITVRLEQKLDKHIGVANKASRKNLKAIKQLHKKLTVLEAEVEKKVNIVL